MKPTRDEQLNMIFFHIFNEEIKPILTNLDKLSIVSLEIKLSISKETWINELCLDDNFTANILLREGDLYRIKYFYKDQAIEPVILYKEGREDEVVPIINILKECVLQNTHKPKIYLDLSYDSLNHTFVQW